MSDPSSGSRPDRFLTAVSRRAVLVGSTKLALGGALGLTLLDRLSGVALAQATPAALDLSMYPELKITATDAALQLSTTTIPAGYVLVTVTNQMTASGASGGAALAGPPAGMSFADFMAQVGPSATPVPGGGGFPTIAYTATILGGPGNIDSGQTGQAIINVPAGQWAVVNGGNNQPAVVVTATAGSPSAQAEPTVAVTITEVDFGFSGFANVPAGPQIWKVMHKGTQPHMLALLSVPAGTTINDLLTAFSAPPNATPAPGGPDFSKIQDAGGVDLQSAGTTVYPVLNLAAGSYAAICFVPDPTKGGEPHVMEGMISIFDVGGAMATPTA